MEEQKKLLEKLEKGKSTLSANDKKLILSTLKSLEESCAKLRGEIDQLLNAAKPKPAVPPKPPPAQKLLSSSPLMKHKRETQKELLDAELELLTDKNAEEKLQLQKRLIELKREAVQLGVLGRGKPGFPANVGTSAVAPGQLALSLLTRVVYFDNNTEQSLLTPRKASIRFFERQNSVTDLLGISS